MSMHQITLGPYKQKYKIKQTSHFFITTTLFLPTNMSGIAIKCFILCFILSANIFQTTERVEAKCKPQDRFQINIGNNLPPNPHKLEVHCASGNNDIGYHYIDSGSNFHFSFCNSFFGNTLFFCHLWWFNRDKAFDVFKSKWAERCFFGRCYWEARGDGIYYSNSYPPINLTKLYDWNVHG